MRLFRQPRSCSAGVNRDTQSTFDLSLAELKDAPEILHWLEAAELGLSPQQAVRMKHRSVVFHRPSTLGPEIAVVLQVKGAKRTIPFE